MKKIIAFALAMVLVLTALPVVADQLSDLQAKGSIVIATEGAWRPWTFHDEKNNLVGFDVEVAALIAEKLSLKAEFAEVDWDGIFAGIDSLRYDVAANGVEVTEERAKKYDFSIPYAYVRTALVVRGDNTEINSFEDLAGKVTANSIGSTYQTLAESYGATVTSVDTLDDTIQMLLYKRCDATLNSQDAISDYLTEHPEADIKVVALTEEYSQVAIPVRKGENETLLAAINQAIEELTESGAITEISMRYFGADISPAILNAAE